ncbi:lysylphosphatidylglycerol synthase transmembrane domain-containing protein [Lapidilactobacillus luobeiensis]|uniref:lysylphosphatidylglycerol synthase transmembrane domain-containing protein n=1 Tax=Lapidilactobacillus luobeiensis TaxID=2950371 RepID=UPI0021C31F47|nr:lysylphosphatidylglycerol synthase transmembrane domain-containing protein [Lapidilactobacillus luobeiensis]
MNRKHKIVLALMILLGVAIFWHESKDINYHQVIRGFDNLKWGWLIVAVGLMLLSVFLEALVVKQLLYRPDEPKQPFINLLRIPPIEAVFNAVTPFSSGGQPAQLVALLQMGFEGGRASSVLLMKFIIYQVVVLFNFILTMIVGFQQVVGQFQGLALLITFGFVIHVFTIGMLLMVMFYYRFTRNMTIKLFKLLKRLFKRPKIDQWQIKALEKIETFHEESLQLKREKKKVLRAAALTLLQLLAYYLIPYFVLLALNVPQVNMLTVFSMHVMIVMITSIFPIPGGAGGAEYSFKTLFSAFVPNKTALILGMFLWRFITFYLGIILGIIAVALKVRPVKGARSRRFHEQKD